MTVMRSRLVAVCLLVSGVAAASAQPSDDGLRPLVDSLVRSQLDTRRIAGAVVVVVQDGKAVLSEGYGHAEVATRRAMASDTPVRIGSVTKMLTALAVMQLVEAGRLDLDRDINEYLDVTIPSIGDSPVTLRRLLSHRTGFEDRRGGIGSWSGARPSLSAFVAGHVPPRLDQHQDLVAYSNVNATLAAYAVERASGETFEAYLAKHLFAPLGLLRTTAMQPPPASLRSLVASGYVQSDRPPTPVSMAAATIYEVGSTGVVASGDDMGRLMIALLDADPRIVSRASLDMMMTTQASVGRGTIGLGVYSPLGAGNNSFIGHDGDTGSFHSTLALLPQRRFGIFASYNSDGLPRTLPPAAELLQQIADRYFANDEGLPSADLPGGEVSGTYQPARRVDSNVFRLRSLFEQLTVRAVQDALTIRPAVLPFDAAMERRGANLFRWAGREISFNRVGGSVVMQLGSPVLQFVQVRWWESAGFVLRAVLLGLIVALVALSVTGAGVLRRRAVAGDALTRRLRAVTRSALLLHVIAIASAFWLVLSGWPLAAMSSPVVIPFALGVYAAAWAAAALTPLALWHCARLMTTGAGLWRVSVESMLALVVVMLTAFSLYWRIAGTSLEF
jgi:CubicO group peptidase (beta-lactamase class C family)